MFKKTNYYWTIYKNLEKELLKISEIIYINNEQLMTFSPYIADLIIRCSIEIESISKELYKINNGPTLFDEEGKEKYLYFDSDCINFLNRKFLLDKKEITISFLNSYIDDDKLRTITPLKHANKQGEKRCKWKYAYQALKHDRINNLKEGNLLNFTQALGALYILNLYLKKEIFEEEYLDSRLNSDIFSINIFIPSGLEISEKMSEESYINFDKNNLKKAIYVKKIQIVRAHV